MDDIGIRNLSAAIVRQAVEDFKDCGEWLVKYDGRPLTFFRENCPKFKKGAKNQMAAEWDEYIAKRLEKQKTKNVRKKYTEEELRAKVTLSVYTKRRFRPFLKPMLDNFKSAAKSLSDPWMDDLAGDLDMRMIAGLLLTDKYAGVRGFDIVKKYLSEEECGKLFDFAEIEEDENVYL